ncbi:MAG: transposase family protein [Planctomycetota bacterium]|jgi:hypothetical protein
MSYDSLHKANERYQLAVMWLLIGAFLVAMALMFVHPTGAILVFWVGLVILGVAVVIEKLVVRAERAAARNALKSHTCPHCGAEVEQDPQPGGEWHCRACSATFLDTGAERPPSG